MTSSTILCVDDERRVLRSLQAALKHENYDIQATTDPTEALRLASDNDIQVVISDQRMPEMEGVELLREIRKRSPRTVRMLLTGYSDYEATVRSVNEGEVFRYIDKPWNPKRLRELVDEAVQVNASLSDSAEAAGTDTDNAPVAGNVLVLDEDPETVELVREAANEGTRIHSATTLEQAFAILADEPIDVLVTEVYVGGCEIFGALKRLKHVSPRVQTVVVTAMLDVRSVRRLINESRIARLLPKPVRQGLLKRSLEATTKRAQALRASPDLTAAERPEDVERPEEQPVVKRVMSYLSRISGR